MMTVIPRFNMRRVLYDYTQGLYRPAAHQYRSSLTAISPARNARGLEAAHAAGLDRVSLRLLTDGARRSAARRTPAAAGRGQPEWPAPADVRVEFVGAAPAAGGRPVEPPPLSSFGPRSAMGSGTRRSRPRRELSHDGAAVFALDAQPPECGQFATEVRIYPWHELLSHPYELGLMKWL